MQKVEVILPKRQMSSLCDGLVEITAAIDGLDPDAVAHGFLGGAHGYGAHFDCDVFQMRPFYWGDCDCGSEERREAWHKANPHADDCWRVERDRRWKAYDDSVGWALIEHAAFGDDHSTFSGMNTQTEPLVIEGVQVGVTSIMTPRDDEPMRAYRKASKARDKEHEKIVAQLYDEYGLKRSRYQWHCSCGVDTRAMAATDLGHTPTCALELPNFVHKPSGFEVRWYKYIGRDMETKGSPPPLAEMFAACLSAVAQRQPNGLS